MGVVGIEGNDGDDSDLTGSWAAGMGGELGNSTFGDELSLCLVVPMLVARRLLLRGVITSSGTKLAASGRIDRLEFRQYSVVTVSAFCAGGLMCRLESWLARSVSDTSDWS